MLRSIGWRVVLGVCVVVATGAGLSSRFDSAVAEDEKPAAKTKAAEKDAAEKGKEEADDPFALPKDADPAKLLKFIDKTRKFPAKTEEQLSGMLVAIEKAADAVLASADAEVDQAVSAVRYKFMVYNTRTEYLSDEKAVKKAEAFARSLEKDKRAEVRKIAEGELLKTRVAGMEDLDGDERGQLIDDVMAFLEKGAFDRAAAQLAMGFAEKVEEVGKPAEAAGVYERVAKMIAKSKDEELAGYAKKLEGVARRLRLPGNPLDVEGHTLDGKPFDWKKYRGKVVLVDYWATWCGPCIRELPNVLANYEKYHAKGFEVVGISLDEDEAALKEFIKEREIPWITLFGKDEATRGWDHPMAAKYGIMGIPTVILVDKEGKVVDLEARGPKLGKLLEKLLGAPDPAKAEPTKTDPAKTKSE